MAGEGGSLGSITITVEVYKHGDPVIWIRRRGDPVIKSREHVPLPQALRDQLNAYALQVVER